MWPPETQARCLRAHRMAPQLSGRLALCRRAVARCPSRLDGWECNHPATAAKGLRPRTLETDQLGGDHFDIQLRTPGHLPSCPLRHEWKKATLREANMQIVSSLSLNLKKKLQASHERTQMADCLLPCYSWHLLSRPLVSVAEQVHCPGCTRLRLVFLTGVQAMGNQQLCDFSSALKASPMHRGISILLRD